MNEAEIQSFHACVCGRGGIVDLLLCCELLPSSLLLLVALDVIQFGEDK